MRPALPTKCPNCGCGGGLLGYKGSYPRRVIAANGCDAEFGVHRYRCRGCGKSVSFLPDFCVPYKHYGAAAISGMLAALLLLGASIRAAVAPTVNRASASRSAVCEWLRQFRRNGNNLRFLALPVASPSLGKAATSDAGLFCALRESALGAGATEAEIFPFWQVKLSAKRPSAGLFRALLIPGCAS